MSKKFQENLISLIKILKTPEELTRFLMAKSAFTENFMELIVDSEQLTKYNGLDEKYHFDHTEIKGKLQYEIDYNHKTDKIIVNITKNDIFSYNDTEEELLKRMDDFINGEEYEKASILNKYLHKLGITYSYIRQT